MEGGSPEEGRQGHGPTLDGPGREECGDERVWGPVFGGLRGEVDEKKARGQGRDEKMTWRPFLKQSARDLARKKHALGPMQRMAQDSPSGGPARGEGLWRERRKQGLGRT